MNYYEQNVVYDVYKRLIFFFKNFEMKLNLLPGKAAGDTLPEAIAQRTLSTGSRANRWQVGWTRA